MWPSREKINHFLNNNFAYSSHNNTGVSFPRSSKNEERNDVSGPTRNMQQAKVI